MVAMGDGVIDEGARVEVAKVDLRQRRVVSLGGCTCGQLGLMNVPSKEHGYPGPRSLFRPVGPCLL